jgi:alkanesulfonate monooxygenase SsuD/methylene tetrahydromethanopterin reductase-like flavin-dependent oxidoreductase (luciferase family)
MTASTNPPFAPGSVSLRLYPHQLDQPTAVLDELQQQAGLAIQSGFDGVMLSERHGGAWGQIPNPLQAAGWLLGAMPAGWVAPCPLLLPLRRTQVAAEEIAWLDARFAGRVGVGFGSGGNEADFRVVGVPFEERNERFDRSLRDIVGLLRGDDEPAPGDPAILRARRVGIPLLSAAMSTKAVRRAAELGIGIIGSSLLDENRTRALVDRFRASGGAGPHVVIVRVWLGTPPWDLIDRQLGEYRHASGGSLSTATEEGLIHSDDASDIASSVVQRLRATRADALNVRVHVAGLSPAAAREQIGTFGREVLPPLRAEWAP